MSPANLTSNGATAALAFIWSFGPASALLPTPGGVTQDRVLEAAQAVRSLEVTDEMWEAMERDIARWEGERAEAATDPEF